MDRGRTTAALLLALSLPCVAGSSEVRVPPDHSLTVEEYIQLGMPPLEPDWSRDERATARSILRELGEQRPSQLPRFASDRSGPLFEKLVHEESFRREELEGRIGEMTGQEIDQLGPDELAQTIRRDSLEGIYAPEATGGLLFDRELVEMAAQRLQKALELRANIESNLAEAEAVPRSSTRGKDFAARYRELLQVCDQILVQRLSQLAAFAIAEQFSPPARSDATSHLIQRVPQIAPFLSAEAGARLHEMLKDISAGASADPRLTALSQAW